MNILQQIRKFIFEPLKASLPRFPEAVLTSFILGILMVVVNELDVPSPVLQDVTRALFLMVPLFVVLTLLREQRPVMEKFRWLLVAGIVFLGFSFWLFLRLENYDTIEFNRFSNLLYTVYLLPIFFPWLWNKTPIETGIITIFTRLFTAMLYAFLLFVGIFILLISANVLFNLALDLVVYANIFILIVTYIFVPTFLSSYPQVNEKITVAKHFHLIWQRIFLFVVAPVITVFTGLVFVYLLTGVFNSDSFESEVYTFSTLVISFAGISAQVALTPFIKKNTFISLFVRYFHFGLIVVMAGFYFEQIRLWVLSGISLSITIQLILGIWPIAYAVFRLRKDVLAVHRGLLMLVGVFAFIAAMPGLNAVSLTTLLLREQFNQTLIANDMLDEEGNIIRQEPLDEAVYERLWFTLDQMENLGFARFPQVPADYRHPDDFDVVFGYKEVDPVDPQQEDLMYGLTLSVLDLSSFDYDQLIYVSSLFGLKEGETLVSPPLTLSLTEDEPNHTYTLNLAIDQVTQNIELYEEVVRVLKARFANNFYQGTNPEEFLVEINFAEMEVDLWVLSAISNRNQFYSSFEMGFYLGINYLGA
ncbi:MAG: hypothetical protein ACO3BB_01905 [Bacilli bacterium]